MLYRSPSSCEISVNRLSDSCEINENHLLGCCLLFHPSSEAILLTRFLTQICSTVLVHHLRRDHCASLFACQGFDAKTQQPTRPSEWLLASVSPHDVRIQSLTENTFAGL